MKTGSIRCCVLAGLLFLSAGVHAEAIQPADPKTPSEVLNFAMLDHRGRLHELRRMPGKAVVLFFTANECPIARQSASKLRSLREKFAERGVDILMVNSTMDEDRKSISKEMANLGAWHIPVL